MHYNWIARPAPFTLISTLESTMNVTMEHR